MSDENKAPVGIAVFTDSLPTLSKQLPRGKNDVKQFLLDRFNRKMPSMIKNYETLGPVLLPAEGFLKYLLEARDLFVEGFDYGAVALCGMVADSICVVITEQRVSGEDETKRILDLGYQKRIKKLNKLGKFKGPRTAELLQEIGEIRRNYIHLRRPNPDRKEVVRIFQIMRLVAFVEFGLVPGDGGPRPNRTRP